MSGSVSTLLASANAHVARIDYPTTEIQVGGTLLNTAMTYGRDSKFNSIFVSDNNFTLSANTQAIFSTYANVSATTTDGFNGAGFESAYAESGIYVSENDLNGSSYDNDLIFLDIVTGLYVGQDLNNGRLLSVSLSNYSSLELAGTLHIDAYTESNYVNVTPVPEPETYAMLLAGLGLIGMVSRKRKM